MTARLDISGMRFGFLSAIEVSNRSKGITYWRCKCECGSTLNVRLGALRSGNTKSCGCIKIEKIKEAVTKHGAKINRKPTPEYAVWSLMRDRCNNANNQSYKYYGGRGIVVAKEWDEFCVFLQDMGERPDGSTIDRINPDGNYEPSNCRWATRKEQSRNRSYCRTVEFEGIDRPLWDLAEEYKLTATSLRRRIDAGWDLSRALNQPIKRKNHDLCD